MRSVYVQQVSNIGGILVGNLANWSKDVTGFPSHGRYERILKWRLPGKLEMDKIIRSWEYLIFPVVLSSKTYHQLFLPFSVSTNSKMIYSKSWRSHGNSLVLKSGNDDGKCVIIDSRKALSYQTEYLIKMQWMVMSETFHNHDFICILQF